LRRFYSKHAGPAIQKLLEATAADAADRHTLDGEVDMCRALTLKALANFEVVCLQEKNNPSPKLKMAVLESVRDCISHTAQVVNASANARSKATTVVTPEDVEYLVDQIVLAVTEATKDHPELAERIVAEVRKVRLPQRTGSAEATAEEVVDAVSAMKRSLRRVS